MEPKRNQNTEITGDMHVATQVMYVQYLCGVSVCLSVCLRVKIDHAEAKNPTALHIANENL